MPEQITNEKSFTETLKLNQLVMANFSAGWCGPSNQIDPVYSQLSYKYPFIKFIRIDTDQVSSLTHEEEIISMPTFVAYFNGKRVSKVVGADSQALELLIQYLADKRHLNSGELREMSVKELKCLCRTRNVPTAGCLEKEDLVQRLMASNKEH
jgi:thioredoxin 1